MLTQIHIQNLATIQELQLDFSAGTTVITGETGAGKSIIIDAIELALGARAAADVVRHGQEKADISLVFDVSKLSEARAWLQNYELDDASSQCVIRRIINKDGRSRSFINNMPTTLQPLREFSELLINIHGQHEHQALLKSERQRDLLDLYAGHVDLVDSVRVLSEEWRTLSTEIKELKKLSNERIQRGEFLKFQINELEELNLTPNEFDVIDLEHKQLANAGELLQNVTHALDHLSEQEDCNALHSLNQSLQSLEMVQHVNPKMASWIESLKNAIIHATDTQDELQRYLSTIDCNPERLNALDKRIGTLFDIARKHRVAPQELYELQKRLTNEFSELEKSDERLTQLTQKMDMLEKHYHEVAHRLSQSRLKAAKKLADEITPTIHQLALPHAEFHILFEIEDFSHPAPHGMEKIIFEIKTNAGQGLLPLAKVVSGGELSRVGLAINLATTEQHPIPILIFDEVDVGIGGATAEIIGKLLRRLGISHQVLCITHAPQVAAQGHHHLYVSKKTENNATCTEVKTLTQQEKINELARMLGGMEITPTALEHAKVMLLQNS